MFAGKFFFVKKNLLNCALHQLCTFFFMTAVIALKLLVPTKFNSVSTGPAHPVALAQYYPLAFFHLIRASKVELRL
jgi:hypothetical protein